MILIVSSSFSTDLPFHTFEKDEQNGAITTCDDAAIMNGMTAESKDCYDPEYVLGIMKMARRGCCGAGASMGESQAKQACSRDVKTMCKNPDNYTPFKIHEFCKDCPLGNDENGMPKCKTKESCTGGSCVTYDTKELVKDSSGNTITSEETCKDNHYNWVAPEWITDANCNTIALHGLAELYKEENIKVTADTELTCPKKTDENEKILAKVQAWSKNIDCCSGGGYACTADFSGGGGSSRGSTVVEIPDSKPVADFKPVRNLLFSISFPFIYMTSTVYDHMC